MNMLLPSLPDQARVWIYTAERPIADEAWDGFRRRIEPFLSAWSSHHRPVTGDVALLHGRFLLLSAYVADGDLSGCGIDKSVHEIEALGLRLGFAWRSALDVAWTGDDGAIRSGTRSEFRAEVRMGAVNGATPVFDTSVTTLGAMRRGDFERRASDCWHGRVFGLTEDSQRTHRGLAAEPTGPKIA